MTDSYIETLARRPYRPRQAAEVARTANAADPLETPRLVAGRYRPGARLGYGRLGEIFEAVDLNGSRCGIERRVAVQLVDGIAAGSSRAAQLVRCCAALSAAPHPNIVRIYDLVQEGRALYVVMELLEGLSLRAILDDAAPDALSQGEVLPIVAAVGEALRYLHTKQMVHGRLQPAGVFVTLDRKVKLLDVPLAQLPATVPYYVEDEQGPDFDETLPSDDVYGLACLTYELLCGRHPFNAHSPLDAHRAGLVPAPIASLRPQQWVAFARALALSREDRLLSIAEFLSALGDGAERSVEVTADRSSAEVSSGDREVSEPAPTVAAWTDLRLPTEPSAGPLPGHAEPGRRSAPAAKAGSAANSGRGGVLAALVVGALGAAVVAYHDEFRGLGALIADIAGVSSPTPTSVFEPRDRAAARPSPETSPAARASAPTVPQSAEPEVARDREPMGADAAGKLASASSPAVEPTSAQREVTATVAPVEPESPFSFARRVVKVSESEGAAALTILRAHNAPASVIWWCRSETAIADEDFATWANAPKPLGPTRGAERSSSRSSWIARPSGRNISPCISVIR